jgi:single-strand DNA-binding protein
MSDRPARLKAKEAQEGPGSAHRNDVSLVGRLAGEPALRELPSGDVLVQFRLVVDRVPPPSSSGRRGPSVDTLDCAAWRKDVQRSLRSCVAGDVLAVEGSLRRRFWRSAGGAASRSEVEVTRLRRQSRPAT